MAKPKVKSSFKEGKWKCTADGLYSDTICGHINPGMEKLCQKCHTHRPKNVEFFLDENAQNITDNEKLRAAKAGVDWKCYQCNYDNAKTDDFCKHCGALRDEHEEKWLGFDQDLKKKSYKSGQVPRGKNKATKRTTGNWKKYLKIGGISLALLLIFVFIYKMFFATTAVEATVTGFSWERDVLIEKYETVIEEDWDYPTDARVLRKEEKQSGTEDVYSHSEWVDEPVYEQVKVGEQYVDCGTIDNGNGTFETKQCLEDIYEEQQVGTERVEHEVYVKEPVYDTWYVYEIDVWNYERTESATGNDKKPKWPEYRVSSKERVQDEIGIYTVHLVSNDAESDHTNLTYQMDESQWMKTKVGDKFIADVKRSGKVVRLTPIK